MFQKPIHGYTVHSTTALSMAQGSDSSLLGAARPAHPSATAGTLQATTTTEGLCGLLQAAHPLWALVSPCVQDTWQKRQFAGGRLPPGAG